MKKFIIVLSALLSALLSASAQESKGLPEDVFYLMPKFGDGMVVYQGKAPVKGSFNICAIDGTVRFKDGGQELAADDEGLLEVVIDNVTFVRHEDNFVRIYPVAKGASIGVKRDVLIMNDSKQGAYGMASQTTAVTEYDTMSSAGKIYELGQLKDFPYRMTESLLLYRDNKFSPLTKKNLQKAFPDHKAEIESFYEGVSGKTPDLDALMAFLGTF